MTGLLWIWTAGLVLLAGAAVAGCVLDAEVEWERLFDLAMTRFDDADPKTAGEEIPGSLVLGSHPSPAVSPVDDCPCFGCECARDLGRNGGRS
ncbi:MAG: hypothetical protein ABR532_08415 [Candidatus Dormibacteria bacterium]